MASQEVPRLPRITNQSPRSDSCRRNIGKREAKLAFLDHQQFRATSARTNIWTLEPEQLTRLVKAFNFTDWGKVNASNMAAGCQNYGDCPAKPPPTLTLNLQEHPMQLCHQSITLDQHHFRDQTRVLNVPSLPDAIPIDQIAHNLSQSEDPHTALMEYINTVLTHAQMLPYFGQRTVKPQHIKDVSEATTHQGCE